MVTEAVRLYGKKDLRLEQFDLPEPREGEILVKIISDALCMSSYKAALQGADHKRVPDGVENDPIIIGHEFCGEIVRAGSKWAGEWNAGDKFAIQPAINYKGSLDAPGYSYPHLGGCATHAIVAEEFMECGCLLHYEGDAFFYGSLAEPMSCIIGAFNASYHTDAGSYEHRMGVVTGGAAAILGGAGPMGQGAIDYALHGPRQPRLLVVTDIDGERLNRSRSLYPPEQAAKIGVKLVYVNTADEACAAEVLLKIAVSEGCGRGFDDVFVFAPVAQIVELGDRILGRDGCLNFFAGPTDQNFNARLNFYNVHYAATHVAGTSGGNTADMREALKLMERAEIDPAPMITHIGGLDAAAGATLRLPEIPGGKKLIYTQIKMPLIKINELSASGDQRKQTLGAIVLQNDGIWCAEAERYLLANFS